MSELDRLLAAMTEGRLEGADRRRLSELIRDDAAARQTYLEHCQMHALLRSAHGELTALSPPARQERKRFPWASAAAALLLVGATAFALLMYSTSFPEVGASLVGWENSPWLIRGGERVKAERADELRVGDRLVTPPDTTGEVRYRDGLTLTLGANTEAEWTPKGVLLHNGSFQADVPEGSRVFRTPHAETVASQGITDLESDGSETRVHALSGQARLVSWGREIDISAGHQAVATEETIIPWEPVCDFDFTALKELPAELEVVFCKSQILHKPERKVLPGPGRARLVTGGLRVDGSHDAPGSHGLTVVRWRDAVDDDLLIEAVVAGGNAWSLGFAVSGDSFEGYRIIFAVPKYPGGISVDTIYPIEHLMLAHDPRPIRFERDHVLRIERRGTRLRVWVDRGLRLDTEIRHPLPETRKRTFALSNFGSPAIVRRLKVWKPAR